jgi:hypothetical protein
VDNLGIGVRVGGIDVAVVVVVGIILVSGTIRGSAVVVRTDALVAVGGLGVTVEGFKVSVGTKESFAS